MGHPGPAGFIPAPAGSACPSRRRRTRRWVYPRACGVCVARGLYYSTRQGLSPRLRGLPSDISDPLTFWRFIPAPAGSADGRRQDPRPSSVYPRACGVCSSVCSGKRHVRGLSPRLRGLRDVRLRDTAHHRFIPAPAGSAPAPCPRAGPGWVYPRACGVCLMKAGSRRLAAGLSPRLRGLLHPWPLPRPALRFIPAPAGSAPRGYPAGG